MINAVEKILVGLGIEIIGVGKWEARWYEMILEELREQVM